MRTVKQFVTPFDVDLTLILPFDDTKASADQAGRVVMIPDVISGTPIRMVAHEPNIRLLLEEAHKGSFVLVWSRSGYEWAETVVTALGLRSQVDLVMSKPLVYFDDMPVETWLKDRVYLEPTMKYKR